MKETVSASLAQQAFIFDEDAYAALKGYLKEIADRLEPENQEILVDVEDRLAEIFRQKLTSPMMVVSLHQVREAMDQMGSPSEFGERKAHSTSREGSATSAESGRGGGGENRIYRSRRNRSIAGLCGGFADYFGCDVSLLRLLTLFLILFGGLSIWVYLILWIIIPEEPLTCGGEGKRNQY